MTRVLYISPLDVTINNGMLQRQHQTLAALAEMYPGHLDVMTVHSSARVLSRWLDEIGVRARVLKGPYAFLARINSLAWYVGNVIARNRLGRGGDFSFPFRTPLPEAMIDKYDFFMCYYPWAFLLLRLDRAGRKVIVDLGDVMGDRHRRIGARRWISISTTEERSILESGARCLAISADDRAEFERIYGTSLPIVPFLPACYEELLRLSAGPHPFRAGFLAAPGYTNEAAMRILCSEYFLDALLSAGVTLVVAGGICDAIKGDARARLARRQAVILGRVAHVRDFYSQVAVVLHPVGPSTGVKIKAVEALLAGKAVVTTRYGADASLREAFSSQVILVDWPIEPRSLASKVAVVAAENSRGTASAAEVRGRRSATYAHQTRAIVASVLRP